MYIYIYIYIYEYNCSFQCPMYKLRLTLCHVTKSNENKVLSKSLDVGTALAEFVKLKEVRHFTQWDDVRGRN